MSTITAASAPISIFNIPEEDPVAYGLANDLTSRAPRPSLVTHLVELHADLAPTRCLVRDNHSKRARRAAKILTSEAPFTYNHDALQSFLALKPLALLESLDQDGKTLYERAFTARGGLLVGVEEDLGFGTGSFGFDVREATQQGRRLRDPNLNKVWLPVRSEAWTMLEGHEVGTEPVEREMDFGGIQVEEDWLDVDIEALEARLAPVFPKEVSFYILFFSKPECSTIDLALTNVHL